MPIANILFSDTEWVVVLKFIVLLLSSGVTGWLARWIWRKVEVWIGKVNSAMTELTMIDEKIKTQQKIIDDRLRKGEDRFNELEDENTRTRDKLIIQISEAAVEMAESRMQLMREFVSEVNLKPKVVDIANNYCRENCRVKK